MCPIISSTRSLPSKVIMCVCVCVIYHSSVGVMSVQQVNSDGMKAFKFSHEIIINSRYYESPRPVCCCEL